MAGASAHLLTPRLYSAKVKSRAIELCDFVPRYITTQDISPDNGVFEPCSPPNPKRPIPDALQTRTSISHSMSFGIYPYSIPCPVSEVPPQNCPIIPSNIVFPPG